MVNGFPVTNPASLVARDASIVVRPPRALRGERKLARALTHFKVTVEGRVAVDVGAAAGGFTKALLDAGARRVYAVDVGFGQLAGSLRVDRRVVNLERTNLAELGPELIAHPVGLVTIDVSYVALGVAVPQLARLEFEPHAELVALVKPQFELGLAGPPRDPIPALEAARSGIEVAGWHVVGEMTSPERGARGAIEFLVHARRYSRRA